MDLKPIFMYAFFFFPSLFFSAQETLLGAQRHQDHPGPAREPTPGKLFIYACMYSFIYFAHKVIRFTQDLREKPLLATN